MLDESTRYLKTTLSAKNIYEIIIFQKNINAEKHNVVDNLKKCIEGMLYVTESFKFIDQLKSTPYNEHEASHEQLLEELWKHFLPENSKTPPSERDWTVLGFQRKDNPRTDFRGMGILGLNNLVYVSKIPAFKLILKESHKLDYSFAITGINLTADIYTYLKNKEVKFRFMDKKKESIQLFSELYTEIFIMFHEYWREKKPNIMEFNQVKKDFWSQLKERNFFSSSL